MKANGKNMGMGEITTISSLLNKFLIYRVAF